MSLSEWMVEADWQWRQSDEGRHAAKKSEWLAQMEMTDEEWWSQNGASRSES
jgi:hypothetical protein